MMAIGSRSLSVFLLGLLGLVHAMSASHAQVFYLTNHSAELWRYDLKTDQAENKGMILDSTTSPMAMVDIAMNWQSELYGVSFRGDLFKIDIDTADPTYIGPTGSANIALAFDESGVLWGADSSGVYTIDTQTGIATQVSKLSAYPSGDIAFSPVTGELYVSAYDHLGNSSGDVLYRIDRNSGTVTKAGEFSAPSVYGFDFTGIGEEIFAMSAGNSINLQKQNQLWEPYAGKQNVIPGYCFGASKYHCMTEAKITTPSDYFRCGDDFIVSGSESKQVTRHAWKVYETGNPDVSFSVLQDGPAGDFNLNDPRIMASGLLIHRTHDRESRQWVVELTTWCDDTEKASRDQVEVTMNAIAQDWEITPPGMNGNQYYFGTETTFEDRGTPLWESGKWLRVSSDSKKQVGDGRSSPYRWSSLDMGKQIVEQEVTHTNGCVSTEQRELEIVDAVIYAPNAFTPNSDGKNDGFRVHFLPEHTPDFLESFRLGVFNRWGQQVFSTTDPKQAWDGRFQGIPAEVGTYFYQVQFQVSGGKSQMSKGDLTLIR